MAATLLIVRDSEPNHDVRPNKPMNAGSQKLRSSVAPLSAAGDLRRWAAREDQCQLT